MNADKARASFEQILQGYAQKIGIPCESLLELEKRQAMLDATLAGKQVEPFATFNEWMQEAARIDVIVGDALIAMLFERQDAEILEDGEKREQAANVSSGMEAPFCSDT